MNSTSLHIRFGRIFAGSLLHHPSYFMHKLQLTVLFLVFCGTMIHAQPGPDKLTVAAQVIGKDTFPVVTLKEFRIIEKPDPEAEKNMIKLALLRRDVRRVLPYARASKIKFAEIQKQLALLTNESDKKKYLKEEEKGLKTQFEDDLKDLTTVQGKILNKLIDREIGRTSYDLIKEFRGTVKAAFWQGVAVVFGSSLTAKYDSTGVDKNIEMMIHQLDLEQDVPPLPELQ